MSEQKGQPEQMAGAERARSQSPEQPLLSGLDALRAHEESLARAGAVETQGVLAGIHGRVEEETRRLTEQLTREEQVRRKEMASRKTTTNSEPTPRRLPEPLDIRSTLVALDGTPYAMRAVPYAAALARLTGSAITLGACALGTHKETAIEAIEVSATSAAADEPPEAREGKQVEHRLTQALLSAHAFLAAAGLEAPTMIIPAQDIAAGLLTLQRSIGAEALALATHGRQGVERFALGSVADEVVRRGHGLTLVVPPRAPDSTIQDCAFTRVLAPLDGSELSEETLPFIRSLLLGPAVASAAGALRALTLLYVAEDRAQMSDGQVYLRELREALLYDARLRSSASVAPIEITTEVALGSPPSAIVAWAASGEPASSYLGHHDLIIMATHGRGGASRWLYGSVASYVLVHSWVPVLLARARS
jgi:nucleotide-binding universal stress UspA family protein